LETAAGSLDDIQAELADGSHRLLQVKFGTDTSVAWEWDDLTKLESGKKRPQPSLLQKWKTSLDAVLATGATVTEAALLTNRPASAAIRDHLSDSGLVNFDGLPSALQDVISEQLGGESAASQFFASFRFRFREQSFESLEAALQERFRRLGGSSDGWTNLMRKIRRWINHKDEPAANGTITLADLRAAALWHFPPQIPQNFLVPDDYVAPIAWSAEVVEPKLRAQGSSLVVVTGSPGAGKSTYLSWLVEQLRSAKGVPVVRHHYFLSTTDTTSYRTGWETAANAIIGQLLLSYEELVQPTGSKNPVPGALREFLVAAGRKREGTDPLVVIVDGLDHVWRDTESGEGLQRLFDLLLPAPNGVVIFVGTQDIDTGRLPRKLRELCPPDEWLNMPMLDGEGVHEWLQHHGDDLGLPADMNHRNRLLGELSTAFHTVSAGHPLILHYAFSAARQRFPSPRPDQILELPGFDPTSSVAAYYRTLWQDVSVEGHQLLHLLAGFPWTWPRDGLVQCLSPHGDKARLEHAERSIRHVLGMSRTGITAFHESLLAFVRALPDHPHAAQSLRPQVIAWLSQHAPAFWQWRYKWEESAKDGDTQALVSSATLDWCIDSLAAGRGRTEIASVVAASGWAALAQGRLGVATERHYIDVYLEEARYAERALASLIWLALAGHDARSRDLELGLFLARKGLASEDELASAAEVAFSAGHPDICQELLKEVVERWNAIARDPYGSGDKIMSLRQCMPLLVAASLGSPPAGPYQRHVSEHGDEPDWCTHDRYAKALARHCAVGDETTAIREELRFIANSTSKEPYTAVDEIVRLAWRDGFDPATWLEVPQARRSGLFQCDQLWVRRKAESGSDSTRETSFAPVSQGDYWGGETLFVDLARSYFFSCLADAAQDRTPLEAVGVEADALAVEAFLSTLRDLAIEASTYKREGHAVGGAWIVTRLASMDPPKVEQNNLRSRFVRPEPVARIAVAIAQDLEELHRAETGAISLTRDVISVAIDSGWTWAQTWIEDRVERRLTMSDGGASRLLRDLERVRLESSRGYLHARSEEYASLAQFCQLHAGTGNEVRSLARLAARNLLGHGFHKDLILFDVLEAIRSAPGVVQARRLTHLRAISPIVQVINEVTDGDETRHLERELAEAVREVAPETLPSYLRRLQRNEHHWQVETCFTDIARSAPLVTVHEKALATTLVHEDALAAFQERVNSGDSDAEAVLSDTLSFLGRQSADTEEPDSEPYTPDNDGNESLPPVEDYPPGRLEEFVEAVRTVHSYGDDYLAGWTSYWRLTDPDGLLDALTRYQATHGYPLARQDGKLVVDLALERSGLSAAWKWLIVYHDSHFGWNWHWYRLSDVQWIWEFVRARAKGRWLEFITKTS
jgi:hypothetical protein